jgi:transcriptional regulator
MLTSKEIEVLQLRKLGLTQIEVAKKLGVSQAAISSFEKNALKKIEDAKKVELFARQMNMD